MSMPLFSMAVYFAFAIVILSGARFSRADSSPLLLSRLNALRGVFALEIVIGHVFRYEQSLLFPLGKFMIISVGFFFFVSGWGLALSFDKKADYLHGFLLSKCGYMALLAVVAYFVRLLVLVPTGVTALPGNPLADFFSTTNWYIGEQILFYILFYMIYRFCPARFRLPCIFLITFIGITCFYLFGMIEGWYASGLAFPLGIAFHTCYDALRSLLHKWYGLATVFVLAVFGLSSLFLGINLVTMVYMRNAICLAGLCLLFLIAERVSFGNKALQLLGTYSVEIYLFQFVWLSCFQSVSDSTLRALAVLGCTILTAVILHPIMNRLRSSFR